MVVEAGDVGRGRARAFIEIEGGDETALRVADAQGRELPVEHDSADRTGYGHDEESGAVETGIQNRKAAKKTAH